MGVDRPEEDDLPRPDDTPRDVIGRTGRVAVEERDRFEYYDALRAAVDDVSAETRTTATVRFRESWAEHCDRWPQEARKPPDRSADPPGSWRGDSGRYLDSAANAEVEQRCDRIADIERTVISPAMREIESCDPERHLAGFDHRCKGPDRLKDKIAAEINEKGRNVSEAMMMAKDVIRYTFVYPTIIIVKALRRISPAWRLEGSTRPNAGIPGWMSNTRGLTAGGGIRGTASSSRCSSIRRGATRPSSLPIARTSARGI
jgi:hypothetical protein